MSADPYTLVERFRNKAGCSHTEAAAYKILRELDGQITEQEHYELRLAHWHFLHGEGPGELYEACKRLTDKYKPN